jgi:hypothetical protein
MPLCLEDYSTTRSLAKIGSSCNVCWAVTKRPQSNAFPAPSCLNNTNNT